jgi:hypothetical protein
LGSNVTSRIAGFSEGRGVYSNKAEGPRLTSAIVEDARSNL